MAKKMIKAVAEETPKVVTEEAPKAAAEKKPKAAKAGTKHLVIVESPTKEKTISRFLDSDFIVRSSFGHVRDLPKDELGVDVKDKFTAKYVLVERAKKIIAELNMIAKNADVVYLATDPDREGEAISWHLREVIKTDAPFKRISFHEITKTAIAESLKSPRDLDMALVNAQQSRRIIDRIVGYKLSPLLWNKIKSGLSAGRVQSVTVRLIAERAKEIAAFKEEDYYTVDTKLAKGDSKDFDSKLVRWEGAAIEQTVLLKLFAEDYRYKTSVFKRVEDTVEAATYLRNSTLKVSKVDAKAVRQKPKPPFITSTLQQDAYNKLGFSSDRTMKVAQSLYEGVDMGGERSGLITYMRTDSFNVSADMQKEAAKFITEIYGKDFCPAKPPTYLKKVKGAQEAHEAIHPTAAYTRPEDLDKYGNISADQRKLYDLIWRRFMASQMEEAIFDSLSVEFSDEKGRAVLRTSGRTVKFEGYLKIYMEEKEEEVAGEDEEGSAALPPLKEGDIVTLKDVSTKAHRTSPPPNYNEASIIKTLEKHGIGRPSTYAVIIKNVVERGYINREKDRKLLITELGALVTEKLKDFFKEIMEISYTASIEDKLDDIADGNMDWVKFMGDFYGPFAEELATAEKDMTKSRPNVIKTDEKCPLCLSPMVQRESRFGKYLSCSRFPKCKGKVPLDKEGNKQDYFVPIKTEKICVKCNKNAMLLRKSARGYFLACSGFPKCRNIEPPTAEEVERLVNSRPKPV